MTAIWARFAASATRVKSLRKLSVEGVCEGGAVAAFVCGAMELKPVDGACCQFVEVWACLWVGEEIGAFIFAIVLWCKNS